MNYKVLVACEESQRVCNAFRKRGFEAYSCDIQETSGEHPEWHILGDVREILYRKWDLIIAHPPCPYLSAAGARFLYPKGVLNWERYQKGLEAKDFFFLFYNHPCPHIAIENPTPCKIFGLPPYTQVIQPYYFGHPYQKRTLLWLKGLPKLEPTNMIENPISTRNAKWFNCGGKERQKIRSKTFHGIAEAMAEQWGNYLRKVG